MALLDSGRLARTVLPPINHPDFEVSRSEKTDHPRYSTMPSLSVSTAPLASPNTIYTGPPPPYSCAPPTTDSTHALSGYFSPPLTSSRRSTRDEKDLSSAKTLPSLPSLHEALGGDKVGSFTGPPSTTYPQAPGSAPSTVVGQTFPDAPKGPSNPFFHAVTTPSIASGLPQAESANTRANTTINSTTDITHHRTPPYTSPILPTNHTQRSSGGSFSSVNRPFDPISNNSPYAVEPSPQQRTFQEFPTQQPPSSHPHTSFNFEPAGKFDDSRNPFVRPTPQQIPYGETVKRHLDSFDAESALNEINEASSRTFDFSRSWSQRFHANSRSSYLAESAPSIQDIDDMMRHQHRVLENLGRLREVVVMQQTALSEQRARAARGHMEDDYHNLQDEYKTGGFAGGDAKKRRGKAAPPGRCHSCNRAETPEWRRGPDGARTLCNACGLHYAKLTRKLGANKASALTGSNLRPKGLDSR